MKQLGSFKHFLGLPLLCITGSVFAGPPVNYDGWSATGGTIDTTVSCSTAGITCTTQVQDDGFLIEEVKTADYTYLRFVVTDPNATGATTDLDFAAETFIPFAFQGDGISQGIAAKQVIREAASGFDSTAELQRAMMRFSNPAMANFGVTIPPTIADDMYSIKLSQTISDPTNGYVDSFDYTGYTAFATVPNMNPDSDTTIGSIMDITQRVDIGEPIDPASKQQYFEQKRRAGVSGNTVTEPFPSNGYFVEGTPLSTANNLTLNGTNVTWADGDEIVSTWLAQESIMSDTTALTHQVIENRTTSTIAVETNFSATMPASPSAWEPVNFGTPPSLP